MRGYKFSVYWLPKQSCATYCTDAIFCQNWWPAFHICKCLCSQSTSNSTHRDKRKQIVPFASNISYDRSNGTSNALMVAISDVTLKIFRRFEVWYLFYMWFVSQYKKKKTNKTPRTTITEKKTWRKTFAHCMCYNLEAVNLTLSRCSVASLYFWWRRFSNSRIVSWYWAVSFSVISLGGTSSKRNCSFSIN